MSQQEHGSSSATIGRYSKRKRAQVNYYIGDEDIEDIDGNHDEDVVEYSPSKKPRSIRPLPKHKVFPFLQLPAELRLMIYDLCLHEPDGINIIATTKQYRRTVMRASPEDMGDDQAAGPRSLVPALLAVNQQINKETRQVLYGNHFRIADPMSLHSFMVNIGPRAASWIKTLTIVSWGVWRGMHKAYNHASFAALASATNIESLRIDGRLYCSPHPKWVARQIYRDAFPWLEAVGVAKGRFDAAVDSIEVNEENFVRRSWGQGPSQIDYEAAMESFREELSKLLGGHLEQMRKPLAKKGKKGKKGRKRRADD